MLYIFNRSEELVSILDNEAKGSCPYFEAEEIEVLNGEHTFTFRVPGNHEDAKRIVERGFVAIKDQDGELILFVITEIEDIHSDEIIKRVSCESASVELLDDMIEKVELSTVAVRTGAERILQGTRWQVGTVQGTRSRTLNLHFVSVFDALSKLIEVYEYEIRFRVSIVGSKIERRYVDLFQTMGEDSGKRIEFSKDIQSIRRTVDARNVKTAIYPIGEDQNLDGVGDPNPVLIDKVAWKRPENPLDKPMGDKILRDPEALQRWGRLNSDGTRRHSILVLESVAQDPVNLLNYAYRVLEELRNPLVNYEIDAIDLGQILGVPHERIRLGDFTFVIDRDLDILLKVRVIERRRNPLEPGRNSFVLGNILPVFTEEMNKERDQIREVSSSLRRAIRDIDLGEIDLEDYLKRGDRIQTEWLEDEIRLASNRITAGGGTVHITPTDGILITDKPSIQDSTNAIRLVAGQLGIANRKNADGSFDFRTFGTGSGFLGDLAEFGFLRFDRSRGGTLTLGGELIKRDQETGADIYEHGILEVINENGDIIVTLDGRQGGFESLFVGHLESPNVVTKQLEDIRIHVDPRNGSDDNPGTSGSPLQTIQEAVNRIPKYNAYVVIIQVRDDTGRFTEPELIIEGFMGQGEIRLLLGNRNIMIGEITVTGNQNWIYIGTVNGSGTAVDTNNKTEIRNQNATGSARGVITCERNQYVYVSRVILNGNDLVFYGIFTMADTLVRTNRVEVFNVSYACLLAGNGTTLENISNQGLSERGIFARDGGIVCGQGTVPWGTSHHVQIVRGAIYNGLNLSPDMGRATPIYPPSTTTIYTPNNTRSFATHNVGWISEFVYNGKRPGDPPLWSGVIYFNQSDFGALKNANGTNRPITRVRLRLKRTNNTGENTSRRPLLYTSTQTTISGGEPNRYGTGARSNVGFTWGQEAWITLPIRFGEEFQKGTARSIVLYDGSSEANYLRFEPTRIQLEITHG